jgi:penicillin-binding protein 1A
LRKSPVPPRRRKPRRQPLLHLAGLALLLVASLLLLSIGVLAGMAMAITRQLPDVSRVYAPPCEATRVYASNGELVASLYRENRLFVPLSQIPLHLQQAVIAVEDAGFYQHRGISLRGMARAMWRNLLARELIEGGSTITQQLARTLFLTQERAVSRKVAEILLALEIERRLTKEEILERYLNQVYFGQGAYGVEMAARIYFGKSVSQLTLPESAMLAGLIRAPSLYSPYENFQLAKRRQIIVLDRMVELGYITAEEAEKAKQAPVKLAERANAGLIGIRAPYFVSYILPQLLERYGEDGVYCGGLQVYTTLDVRMQAIAEKAVRLGIDAAQRANLRVTQGALVAIDPRTGAIRAMIGGYDFRKSQFNRAWQARRQPGSAFKPFIYVTALANGIPPTRVIVDEPISLEIPGVPKKWEPENYDLKFRGPVTLRQAVEQSINIPAIKILNELGPQQVIAYAHRMGIKSPLPPVLSLALGTAEVTPLEMASAFGVLAANGIRAEPFAIARVEDRQGRVLEEFIPRREVALKREVAYLMTDILKGVILRGTGRAAEIGRPAAGKTGTTDDYRNAWFVGYTPQLVASVWVGNDDNTPMRRVVGGTVPARIWAMFMKEALAATPPEDWPVPEGIVEATVCGSSGLLATGACPNPKKEIFIKGTEPTEYDTRFPGTPQMSPPARVASPPPSGEIATQQGETRSPLPPPSPRETRPSSPGEPIPFLSIETPADGGRVTSPFLIQGRATPGSTVLLIVYAEGGVVSVKSVERELRVGSDGKFQYEYKPMLRVPGVRYVITVRMAGARGEVLSQTISVVEG